MIISPLKDHRYKAQPPSSPLLLVSKLLWAYLYGENLVVIHAEDIDGSQYFVCHDYFSKNGFGSWIEIPGMMCRDDA